MLLCSEGATLTSDKCAARTQRSEYRCFIEQYGSLGAGTKFVDSATPHA